jgi:peptidyl-prolyl cis-trans isomerase C
MFRVVLTGLIATFIAAAPAARAASDAPAAAPLQLAQANKKGAAQDVVVARVVGQPVHQSDVVRAFRSLPPQVRQQGLERHYGNLLETLVVSKMLTIYGRRLSLEKDARVKAQLKLAEDALVRDVYLGDLVRKQITDAMLKERYAKWAKKNQGLEEIRARHVLVESESEAKKVIKLAKAGHNFADLAKKHSVGRTRTRGGDLGYFTRGDMVKPFSDAAFALKPGQITQKPVKSDFGWHVIKLEDKRKRKVPPFDKVKPLIRQQVGQELSRDIVNQLLRQTKVERFSFDGKQSIPAPVVAPDVPTSAKP